MRRPGPVQGQRRQRVAGELTGLHLDPRGPPDQHPGLPPYAEQAVVDAPHRDPDPPAVEDRPDLRVERPWRRRRQPTPYGGRDLLAVDPDGSRPSTDLSAASLPTGTCGVRGAGGTVTARAPTGQVRRSGAPITP